MKDVVIRLASPDEIPIVHKLMHEAFAEYVQYQYASSALAETVDDVRRATSSPQSRAFLVRLGNEELVVGSGRFAVHSQRPLPHGALERVAQGDRNRIDDDTAVLSYERLAVAPAHRGSGIGHAMVSWLEQLAICLGCVAVEVDARSQQPDNRPFYLRRGYRIVGYSGRYGIPDLRTHLRKELSSGSE